MKRNRGKRPLKRCEGSCRRRIKKPTRQAGSPESRTRCPCPVGEELQREVSRLAYSVRRSFVSPGVFRAVRDLVSLSSRVLAKRPVRVVVRGEPLRRRPVPFSKGPVLPPGTFVPRPKVQSLAVLNYREVPRLGYDPRVIGTWLEGAVVRDYRRIFYAAQARSRSAHLTQEEADHLYSDPVVKEFGSRWLVVPTSEEESLGVIRVVSKGLSDPFPRARISGLELSRLLLQGEGDRELVSEVRAVAPPSLADLLAGESWGVMDFSKMNF